MKQFTSTRFRWTSPAVIFLLAASVACGGAGSEKAGEAVEREPVDSAEPAEAPADAAPPAITPFGVPECDNYVKAYLTCVESRVSGEQKQRLLDAMTENQTKWRALASMREGAIALSLACRTAAQKSKEAMTVDYGCEF